MSYRTFATHGRRVGLILGLIMTISSTLLLPKAALANAQTSTYTIHEKFLEITFSPCNGEEILVETSIQGVSHISFDSNGGYHVAVHSTFHNSGVGLSTGQQYMGQRVQDFQGYSAPDGAPFTGTDMIYFTMRSPGPNNDFFIRYTTHITVNANGDVTVSAYSFDQGGCILE